VQSNPSESVTEKPHREPTLGLRFNVSAILQRPAIRAILTSMRRIGGSGVSSEKS